MGGANAGGGSPAVRRPARRLTQRFVDRRTAVLVRDIGARGADALPVTVAADGEVSVGPEPIGHLDGLRVPGRSVGQARRQAPAARRRRAAPRRRARSPRARCRSARSGFRPHIEETGGARHRVAGPRARPPRARPLVARTRGAHRPLARPALRAGRAELRARLERWLEAQVDAICGRCKKLAAAATDPATSPGVRALSAMLADAGGVPPRKASRRHRQLEQADRQALHRLGVRLGPLDVFVPPLSTRRPALARGACSRSEPASRCRPSRRRRRDLRAEADPRGAAWPIADSAAAGSASTSPTASPATPARCAPPVATTRSMPSSRLPSGLATRRPLEVDGRHRLRPGRRCVALARPTRSASRTRAAPSHAFAELAKLEENVRIDRFLHCIRLVKSRSVAQTVVEIRPCPDRRKEGRESRGRSPRRQRHRPATARPDADDQGARAPLPPRPCGRGERCYEELGIDEPKPAT